MLNFLIKPSSSACNMRCRYCFFEDEAAHRQTADMGRMNQETAELLIREACFSSLGRDGLHFAFQGGEPTLMGLPFFQHFVTYAAQQNPDKRRISYSIQTNGLALTEEWADFLYKHHFLVGLSLDGPKNIHDELRRDAAGRGTWNRVTKSLALLNRRRVHVNVLCVVTSYIAKSPVKVYRTLKNQGVGYIQFIPCLDPLEKQRGALRYSLRPADYGRFLCAVFDEWYRDWEKRQYVSVRLFDDYVYLAMGLPAGTCAACGRCGGYFVVEGDGGIYPCDFYTLDAWRCGRLGELSLEEIQSGPIWQSFLERGRQKPSACSQCPWESLCGGGCPRDWHEQDGETKNYYCSAFQQFFAYAGERILHIARAEQQDLRKKRLNIPSQVCYDKFV